MKRSLRLVLCAGIPLIGIVTAARNALSVRERTDGPGRADEVSARVCRHFQRQPEAIAYRDIQRTAVGFAPRRLGDTAPSRVANLAPKVEPQFPERFSDAVRVRSGVADVSARPLRANSDCRGAVANDGSLVYQEAFEGCDVVYRSETLKTEEFIVVNGPASARAWSWQMDTGNSDTPLKARLTPMHSIEFCDASGDPRLRINPPEGRDAAGKLLRAGEALSLTLSGSVVTLSADLRSCEFPVVIDPTFGSTGTMTVGRVGHTLTRIGATLVLAAGGAAGLTSCELFDPAGNGGVGSWSATSSMTTGRSEHAAILMNDGRVLACGGAGLINSTEIFTLGSGWVNGPNMVTGRQGHSIHLTFGGGTVYVVGGGTTACEGYTPSIDPFNWVNRATMPNSRFNHAAVFRNPNNVTVIAGDGTQRATEVSDSGLNGFFILTNLNVQRAGMTGTLLQDERTLVCGGGPSGAAPLVSCEVLDAGYNFWTFTGSMAVARRSHTANILSNGKVVVIGGSTDASQSSKTASCEVFDPGSGGWQQTEPLIVGRDNHKTATLADGRILISGGIANGGATLASCEIFDPRARAVPQSLNCAANSSIPITLATASIGTGVSFSNGSPSSGVLSGTAPNLTYTPNTGFTGSDSFTFTVSDSFGTGAPGTINIGVTTGAPVLTAISPNAADFKRADLVLTVDGNNFVGSSVVRYGIGVTNKTAATTFVSPTRLTAVIPASEFLQPGPISVQAQNSGSINSALTATLLVYSGSVGNWIVSDTRDGGGVAFPFTLRTAMMFCRAGDKILFDQDVFDLTNSEAATFINVLSTPLPNMDRGNVSIDASDRRVTLNGSGAGSASGLNIITSGNQVRGLSIIGFSQSGISIRDGAKNNVVGGSRISGTGPNGQGLRISGNGTYGVEITGAGTDGNVVKGCWIGLDSSGSGARPNLAGMLLQGGAKNNIIGGTADGEANVISGNDAEGVTISGAGTDGNAIIGNLLGTSGVPASTTAREVTNLVSFRTPLGNGASGVFLSRGTTGSRVGGDGKNGNVVGFNGGSGIEVRAIASRRNSSRANSISRNGRGGIKLFDGSNDGIRPPRIESLVIPGRTSREVAGRAFSRASISGTADVIGDIELFNDGGDQGTKFLGTTRVVDGKWTIEVEIDEALNLTATLTDANGNTSPFAFFASGGTTGISGADSDGDGISDALEALAGTDPANAADKPVKQGATAADKASFSLSFAKANKDTLALTLRMILPNGFVASGATAAVLLGGVSEKLTLDAKGSSPRGSTMLKLKTETLQFTIKNGSLKDKLAGLGMLDTDTGKSGISIELPIVAVLNSGGKGYVYEGSVSVIYKATQGKSGRAAKAK